MARRTSEWVPRTADEAALIQELLNAEPSYPPGWTGADFEFDELLVAWPEPLEAVSKTIAATPAALKAFLAGSHDRLTPPQIVALRKTLAVRRDPFGGDYSEADGPYIFLPKRPEDAKTAYDCASGGGDVDFCVEVVPTEDDHDRKLAERGAPHLVCFRRSGSDVSFFLIERQARKLPAHWRAAFFNMHPEAADVEKYDDYLNAAVNALISPLSRGWILHQHSLLFEDELDALATHFGP